MKKASCLIMLLFSSYYGISLVSIGTTQAQLDVSGGGVRLSNYRTETEVHFLGLGNDKGIIETSLNYINHPKLQYYTRNISNTSQPHINNKHTLGVSSSQGAHNVNLNDLAAIAANNNGYFIHHLGTITVNNTRSFTFNARSDDASRIYNVLVVQNQFKQSPSTKSKSITLAQGKHKIEFWYYENSEDDFMKFTWSVNPDSDAVGSVINTNEKQHNKINFI